MSFSSTPRRIRNALTVVGASAGSLLLLALVHAGTLSHGPVIGDVGPDRVQIWGRTDAAATVTVEYAPVGLTIPQTTLPLVTSAGSDFTFALPLRDLMADTAYEYRLLVDGTPSAVGAFQTAPPHGDSTDQVIAFVADAFHTTASTVWAAVATQTPDGVFVIGDFDHSNPGANVASAPTALAKMRVMHRRLRGPETPIGTDFKANVITPGIPLLGRILDDHDSGIDNISMKFKWWGPAFQAFLEYHPVPEDNGFPVGMWQALQRGRALFLLLDVRSNRNPDGIDKTILGPRQKVWLTARLAQCAEDPSLTWCVLVTPVPFNPNQQKFDSWRGYPADRQWLLAQIAALNVRNLLVVSGDCHWGSIVLPPLSPLPELNVPKANEGFGNTCNAQPSQWTVTSTQGGTGFGLLTLRADEAVLAIYNTNGKLRFSTTVAIAP